MKIEILGSVLLGFFAFHNLIRQILKYLFFLLSTPFLILDLLEALILNFAA